MRSWPAVWRSGVALCYGVCVCVGCAVWIREGVACGCAMAWPIGRLWRVCMAYVYAVGVALVYGVVACGGVMVCVVAALVFGVYPLGDRVHGVVCVCV